jgi:FixJ family two-component response regulator
VDDDQWIRRSLERLLKSAGLRAESFISAEDYLAAGKHEETGCIILDIGLPGMNGFELERSLTADRNPRPIVFV